MEIYLKNSLSGEKEVFKPVTEGKIGMYNCGPTVYNKQHIGNLRTFIVADLLRRNFEVNGYDVKQVINITDVGHLTDDEDQGEDKLEKVSKETGEKATDIAEVYTNLFFEDLEKLNIDIKRITFPRATRYIDEQIELIKALEEKEFTYTTSDGVYYDTSKFDKYGELGNIDIEGLKEGARVDANTEKKNITDFALWKLSGDEERQQEWDSPWGVGFPGWHLECSAMSKALLGAPFDIHTGGIEHIPVHHNNEIAQSEAAFGETQANYWLHHNHILLGGEKMAKSVGNVVYISDLKEKNISPLAYRYWLLTSHYSTQTNFTDDAVSAAASAFQKILTRFAKTKVGEINSDYSNQIKEKLNDNLNTPEAIAIIWQMLKDDSVSEEDKLATILEADKVFGLNINELRKEYKKKSGGFFNKIKAKKLLKLRDTARENKDYAKADQLRDEIGELGFEVADNEGGSYLR